MNDLTLDHVREILPELDELRPIVDHAIARSEPDESRAWSGSGRLATLGARLVSASDLQREASRIADAEAEHLRRLYETVGRALAHVAGEEPALAAEAFLQAAALEEARDRPRRAEAYAGAACRVLRHHPDRGPAALALRRWARAARATGKLDIARERYEGAYEAGMALSDARGAAEAAVGAGNVLEEQGRWAEAATWYEAALAVLEDVSEPAPERWHALLNLHIVHRSAGSVEESVSLLLEAEAEAGRLEGPGAETFLQNAWGQLRMAQGDFDAAEVHLSSALQNATDARARVTVRLNLAEARLARRRTLGAAEQAREAERDAIAAGLVSKLPEVYRVLGRAAAADGDPDAFVLFERALEITRERELPALEEGLTLQAYAECAAAGGDAAAAAELAEAARERLAAIGIEHTRQPWADVFGPGTATKTLPDSGATEDE